MKFFFSTILIGVFFVSCEDSVRVEPKLEPEKSTDTSVPGKVLNEKFEDQEFTVFIQDEAEFVGIFDNTLPDGTELELRSSDFSWPIIFTDKEGNSWNCFGEAVIGPRKGAQLEKLTSTTGYWFSIGAFFRIPDIFGMPPQERIQELTDFGDWRINPEDILRGQIPDGIPSLTDPVFDLVTNERYKEDFFKMAATDLVTVVKFGQIVKIYPNKILDHHEVVNDQIEDMSFVLSYCPLTGTADVWEAELNGKRANFGVSGLIYQSNLILFDRETNSFWSQLKREAVHGEFVGELPVEIDFLVMNWAAIEPLIINYNVQALSRSNTTIDYDFYPYGEYRDIDEFLLFPIEHPDLRIGAKEVVTAVVINDKAKTYRFSDN